MNRHLGRRQFCLGLATTLVGFGAGLPGSKVQLGIGASLGGTRPFQDNDPWNQNISEAAVDPRSNLLLKSIGLDKPLHPDFGTVYQGRPVGFGYVVVPGSQPRVPVRFEAYPEESDQGPYPIPLDAPIEGGEGAPAGDDRHVLVIDRDAWKLYEIHSSFREGDGWRCGSGAIFDLANNTNRPFGWTSADAAGLPIFPGLVRYDEAAEAGAIRHALRFTCARVRRGYVTPARHWANRLTDPNLPPFGMRVRLKRGFDLGGFPPQARTVLQALKTYGMILADIGADWFISGSHDMRWDVEDVGTLRRVKGRDLEVVKMGQISTG